MSSPARSRTRAGLRSGDEITAINGTAVAGQRDVVFGLLDAMSGQGQAVLAVRSASGAAHAATLAVTDSAERRRLTEPSELFKGLGFEFWEPTVPAVLGKVIAPTGPRRAPVLNRAMRSPPSMASQYAIFVT